MKLEPAEAEAISNLLVNPDFRVYMQMLGKRGEQDMKVLVWTKEDKDVYQGRTQVWSELIDDINQAPQTVQDYKKSK